MRWYDQEVHGPGELDGKVHFHEPSDSGGPALAPAPLPGEGG